VRVLIVEDYEPLRTSLVQGLREAGYAVDATGNGEEGFWFADSGDYDVIILDLMLPELDGWTITKRLRARGRRSHILMLTAKDSLSDRVAGLQSGADDYLVKPFAFAELLARVGALVRRRYESKSPVIRIGDLEIDTRARTAHRAGSEIDLTAREYTLLELLARRKGEVVTRDEIWEHTYDFNAEPRSNVIDVYVGMLRRKLEQGGLSRLIHTRRGLGYVLEENR